MSDDRPGKQAGTFFAEHKIRSPVLVTRAEFDKMVSKKQFVDGPFRETFGDGYGESYNPDRQAFGKLKDGRGVYCELTARSDGGVK
jgi:hypothetical protein